MSRIIFKDVHTVTLGPSALSSPGCNLSTDSRLEKMFLPPYGTWNYGKNIYYTAQEPTQETLAAFIKNYERTTDDKQTSQEFFDCTLQMFLMFEESERGNMHANVVFIIK